MTVRLEITYDASDGVTPASVVAEWGEGDTPPGVDGLIRLVEGVAAVADRRSVAYATAGGPWDLSGFQAQASAGRDRREQQKTQPDANTPGFRAAVDIVAGARCWIRPGSDGEVEMAPNRVVASEFLGLAEDDFTEGEALLWAAAPTGKAHIWRRAL
jgi:hypothetical protein